MSKIPRRRTSAKPGRLVELSRELERRKRLLPGLYRRLANAEQRVQRILASIRAMEDRGVVAAPGRRISRTPGPPPKKPAPNSNIVEALAKLLKKKPMSPAEAARGVRNAGYTSPMSDLLAAVTRALTGSPRFERRERGRFTSKD